MKSSRPYVLIAFLVATAIAGAKELYQRFVRKTLSPIDKELGP